MMMFSRSSLKITYQLSTHTVIAVYYPILLIVNEPILGFCLFRLVFFANIPTYLGALIRTFQKDMSSKKNNLTCKLHLRYFDTLSIWGTLSIWDTICWRPALHNFTIYSVFHNCLHKIPDVSGYRGEVAFPWFRAKALVVLHRYDVHDGIINSV